MRLKLLEALEGGARSVDRQTLNSQAKPVTEGLKVEAAVVFDFMFIVFVCKYWTRSFSKLSSPIITCLPKINPNLVVDCKYGHTSK
ncbi:hypothetical protein EAF00_001672 [Botryotinia globosa]|nr:hypothetical protein EAF00_001672 [Botryotinia globosa]